MHSIRRSLSLICLLLLSTALTAGQSEVVARCGEGYLERIDGRLILHLKGTPYQMGYQHGTLLKEHVHGLMSKVFKALEKTAKIEFLGVKVTPKSVIYGIVGIERPHIPQWYTDEINGLADAVGSSRDDVMAANFIPELFHCSGFALLKENTTTGSLLHGRVLDYATDWNLQDHAVVIVAEPSGGIPFVNVSYAGFIGSVTGMNKSQVSIGEMGGRGLGKWNGTPMAILVRRVLQEANDLDQAVSIFEKSKRTCQYFFVIADAKRDSAVGMEASADAFQVIQPGDPHPLLPKPVPGTVLLSAGKRYDCLSELVSKVRNSNQKFDVERATRLMDSPVAMGSNLHNVLMSPGTGKLWVANAASDRSPAWKQKSHEVDFWKLLSQPRPTTGAEFPPPPERGESGKIAGTPSNP